MDRNQWQGQRRRQQPRHMPHERPRYPLQARVSSRLPEDQVNTLLLLKLDLSECQEQKEPA